MLQAVEPPVLYAVVGVILLAVASLFGLVLFASREETFEDVVAKQRKAQEALLNSLQGGSGKSGKQNKKWNKLKNKKASKVKEQEENEIDSGVDDDEPSSESVSIAAPPPVIAVEEPPPPPTATKKKKKKGKKGQQQEAPVEEKLVEEPVVIEEETVTVVEEVPVEQEVEEEIIVDSTNDEVEATPELPSEDEIVEADDDALVEESEILPSEDVPQEAVPEEIEPEESIVTEIAEAAAPIPIPAPAEPVNVVVETTKPRKKKSNKSKEKGVITNTVDKLAAELEDSHLSAEEVQQVMDVLLKKQNEFEQWQKPNQKSDPMEILKKRIAEAELQFAEERQSAQAIALKNKELRLELQQERNARQSIQNEATNRLNQQAKEGEAIRKRLEEKHLSEMHSAQSQISRMQDIIDDGANHHMELQRLKEENSHLKNASMMAQQLAEDKQSLMTELSQLQQTNKSLRQEFDNMILHNQQELNNLSMVKVESETALSNRLQEVNEQLMKVEAQNRSMQQQIEVAEQCKVEMESHQMSAKPEEVEELNAKLLQIETKFNDSESLVKVLHEQLEVKTKELEETRSLLTEAQNKLTELESKVTEQESEKEVEPVNEEVANLVAKVAEKDQMILVLEQQVSTLESQNNQPSSGQHSPDMVVVTSSDLLGSEPILTSESFEEVTADKDFQDETDNKQGEIAVEVTTEVPVESAPEESLLVEAPVTEAVPKTVEALEKEIEDLKVVEKSLQETIAQLEASQTEIRSELDEKIAIINAKNDAISEKDTVIAEKMDAILKAEESLQEAERLLAESNATIVAKEDIIVEKNAEIEQKSETIREKESTIAENLMNIYDLKNTDDTTQDKTSDINKLILEKDQLITELKEKVTKLEESTGDSSADGDLAEKLKKVEEELKEKTESASQLTAKNNELREKNWKVIDALGKAESTSAEKVKAIEISICKGLKQLFPDVNIPKYDNDIDLLFKEFAENVGACTTQKSSELNSEVAKTDEINKKLMEEIAELKKTNELMQASQDEVLKSQEENVHLKNVLTETESMLSRLQTGVDAEVQKWQKKVNEKDVELEETKKGHQELKQILLKHGYEHENLTTLEANLSDGQKQLMAEKQENTRIKTELQELEQNLATSRKEKDEQAQKLQEMENAKPSVSDGELADLNAKLKKTVSERDLLIREYKSMKDNHTKLDAELKSTKDTLAAKLQSSDVLMKEIEQLKAAKPSSPDATDKDAEIKKLNIEIEELKEELREERDCVIVDIDPDNAENLHKQVETLSTELESEKQCKANLASKLEDIEKSYQEECSDDDKILDLESKLKSAEAKIKELEAAQSKKLRQDVGDNSYGTSV